MRAQHLALVPRCLAAGLALAGFAGSANAEGSTDMNWGQLEYFFPTISSTARLDDTTNHLPGTEIHLEDDLGLTDRKGTPYLLLGTRFGSQRWRMEFEYYFLDRSATRTIQRQITWGGVTYDVGANINSTFNTNVYRLTGGWSFYRTPEAEGGVSLGFHVTDFKLALSGEGTGPAGLSFQTESRTQLVPLPTLGAYGNYKLAPDWILHGRFDWLSLTYEQYHGSLYNLNLGVDWRFVPNWGVGVGYRYVNYKLEATKNSFHGEANYEFQGPTVYVAGAF
jgi:hypothetical protein